MNSKGKRYNNSNKSVKKILITLVQIFFIILFVYSGIKIVKYIIDAKENSKIIQEISESIVIDDNYSSYKIDFDSLKQKNPDIVGFIKVNGTDVAHTVVQGNDNSYYLYHNFYKESNAAGWIFADYRNKLDETDKNIIIYGHNMKNDSMFGTLKNILQEEWYKDENNKEIIFVTEKGNYKYQVFSVYQIENEDYYIKTQFDDSEFDEFLQTIKARSKYDFNVDIDENDTIITLSTCSDSNKERIVLHAKLIK